MRPDLDDYEDLTPETESEPRGRVMSWLVLGVAVFGFAALAYYAYQSGSQTAGEGQMLVVSAPEGPIRETPADPGGEEFPHKDKTIYNALSPYRTDGERVEKLLPEPEEPVIPEPAVSEPSAVVPAETATRSYVNTRAEPSAHTEVVERTSSPPAAQPLEKEEIKDQPVAAPASTRAASLQTQSGAPVKTAAETAVKPAVTPAPVKPAVAARGEYKIQLGAFRSEGEARQTWNKIASNHGDLVTGSPIIVRADLPNGTFYRLRASGFATAEAAKKACATLAGRKQGCFYVGR